MELTTTQRDGVGRHEAGGESVSSAFEHLVVGSQRVITKRIDLALLESQELLAHMLQRAALAAAGIAMAAAAWFAVTTSFILVITPGQTLSVRLAAFGLLNGGVALGLLVVARRRGGRLPLRNGVRAIEGKEQT